MVDTKEQVRETAKSLGIEMGDSRLDQLAAAWKDAMADAELVRPESNPSPTPSAFDASWSDKR